MDSKKASIIQVIVAAFFWGCGGIAAQELYKISEIPSLFVVFLRMLTMAVVFVPVSIYKKKDNPLEGIKNKKDLTILIFFALFGSTYVQYSYYEAIRYSNAATGTVLQYAAPIFVLVAMAFINKKFPKLVEILCVIMAVAGIFLISTHGNVKNLAISPRALFFGITGAMAYAFYSIEPVNFIKKYGSMYLLGFSSVISVIILLLSGKVEFYAIENIQELLYILFILIFGTLAAFGLFLSGVAKIGSTKASVLSAVEPVVSAVMSIAFFSVAFTFADGIGMVLVVAATLLLTIYGGSLSENKK